MPELAFDTLDAARRLKSAGIDSEHAETIVEVMGKSVNQLVTREHFDAGIAQLGTELHARIDGVESKVQSLNAAVRTEIMRAVLIVVGILIPAIGLMIALVEFYSARGAGA